MIYVEIPDDLKSSYKDYILDKKYQTNLYFKQRIDKSFRDKLEQITKYKRGELRDILNFFDSNLESYIIGDLDKLQELQNELEFKFPKFIRRMKIFLKKRKKNKRANIRGFKNYEVIYDLFVKKGYDTIISNKIAYTFIKTLNIKVCPYCNINYISYVGSDINKNMRPALDHFYPKEKYPWFALSLYNLVPICNDCNSLKSNKFPIGLKNVYDISKNNDNFLFRVAYNCLDENMSLDDIEDNIEEVYFLRSIDKNNRIFKLYDRYQFHKDVVSEIIWKNISKHKVLLDSFEELGINREEAYRLAYCNYFDINNFKQRPLAKLTYDISITHPPN